MNFEKIEQAYTLILENVQNIQNALATNFYDALIEQNGIYLDGDTDLQEVLANDEKIRALHLNKEEWRRAYQFILMKAAQTEPMQVNHQFTPDTIGFLITFLLDQLAHGEEADVLEIGSGTGNLAETILNHTQKKIDYLGLELDDLLIDLSASIAEVMNSKAHFAQYKAGPSGVLPIKSDDKLVMLRTEDIILADINQTTLMIYSRDGIYQTTETLTRFQQRISSSNFIQVSRHAVINIDHLESLSDSFSGNMTAKLTNQIKTEVSRRYVKLLMEYLGI